VELPSWDVQQQSFAVELDVRSAGSLDQLESVPAPIGRLEEVEASASP